jgi:hypothetical protein
MARSAAGFGSAEVELMAHTLSPPVPLTH